MAQQIPLIPPQPLLPWTDLGLRMLENMVSLQQQAWDQWFRFMMSFSPPVAVFGDPVTAAETAGAIEAAAEELEAPAERRTRRR